MIDDIEKHFMRARLNAPSADLDRRIALSCATAEQANVRNRNQSNWLWWFGSFATSGVAAVFILSLHRANDALVQTSRAEAAVYQVEAEGQMREMLTGPSAQSTSSPKFIFEVKSP